MDTAARFLATAANRFLGTRLIEASPNRTKLELTLSPQFVQEEGVIHGGVIAMLADTAAVYLLLPQMRPSQTTTSIEFKLNFLSAARACSMRTLSAFLSNQARSLSNPLTRLSDSQHSQ
jgi:uncharacterized protein (TIGR00369 family)